MSSHHRAHLLDTLRLLAAPPHHPPAVASAAADGIGRVGFAVIGSVIGTAVLVGAIHYLG